MKMSMTARKQELLDGLLTFFLPNVPERNVPLPMKRDEICSARC